MKATSDHQRIQRGKLGLLLFAGIVIVIMLSAFFSGLVIRDDLRELGGPLHVATINEADIRLRADLFAGEERATIEMDPGERGMVRFAITEPSPVEIRIFQEGSFLHSIRHGKYQPNERKTVQFYLESAEDLRIVETESP